MPLQMLFNWLSELQHIKFLSKRFISYKSNRQNTFFSISFLFFLNQRKDLINGYLISELAFLHFTVYMQNIWPNIPQVVENIISFQQITNFSAN